MDQSIFGFIFQGRDSCVVEGSISVEGEAEEITVSPRTRYWQLRHGKRSNPYSTSGLDKFEDVYAELSARREYVAKNIGAPEALVKFAYSKNGWVPVVVRAKRRNPKEK